MTIPVPALTGSEKQIAWAEGIRKKMVYNWLHEKCESYGWVARLNEAKEMGIDTCQEMVEKLLAASFSRLFKETSAKQIIENRYLSRF